MGMAGKKAVSSPTVTRSTLHFPTHLRSTPLIAVDEPSGDGDVCRRSSATHYVVLGIGGAIVTLVLLTFGQQSSWPPCDSATNISQIIPSIVCIWDTTLSADWLPARACVPSLSPFPASAAAARLTEQQKC